MVSKATKMKAKKQLALAKVKLARLKVQARVQAKKMGVLLGRHQKAMKAAAKRYKSALKSS